MIKLPSNSGNSTVNRAVLRVALIYAGYSLLWILFSNQIVPYFLQDLEVLTGIQMIKRRIFVIVTAFIVYVLLYREITKINQGKEELRIEKNNLNNIFDAMKDCVHIFNRQYEIQYVNPALQKEFGPSEGLKCFEYFYDKKEPVPWYKNHDIIDGGTMQQEWFSEKNGKTYELIGTPFKNPDGSISMLEIFKDITERKKVGEELNEYHDHLEELVTERTDELKEKNAELKQFNKIFIDREFRIKELKAKVKKLEGNGKK